jgi:ethanolamine utilization protein EutA
LPTLQNMLSVGIDIGTTTTQVVFSKLTMADKAHAGQIPKIDIIDREVIYESNIVFTPLIDSETIDAQRLSEIIKHEYTLAGVSPSQVETGAVIITGETARKKNADRILEAIAGLAGDFVVTVAGPNVESMISGRGSGAASYSRQHFTTVVNIDIGGGSSNSAVFRQGNLIATAAMSFGGRVVEIEGGQIRHITLPAQIIIDHLGMQMHTGDLAILADLMRITDCMAGLAVELIEGTSSPLAQLLYLTSPSSVSGRGKPVMFSGGIGYYYYHPIDLQTVQDVSIHGDIGPLLAQSLRRNHDFQRYRILQPAETLRATVLGASSQMVSLSGSTIWAEGGVLPLRNIPVVEPDVNWLVAGSEKAADAIRLALQRWDLDSNTDQFAIALELDGLPDYKRITEIAGVLVAFMKNMPENKPLIVIVQRDYARVLGQTMKPMLAERPLLVIDQVGLQEGNYIDIGEPMMDGRVVPLSVKTLVFYH